jgi:hypothetical protein
MVRVQVIGVGADNNYPFGELFDYVATNYLIIFNN